MSDTNELNKQLNRDNLLMSAWLHQMSAVWSMHRYAALVEAGGLSGWYLLVQREDFTLASALLVVCTLLLYLMIITIKRNAQLLQKFNNELKMSGVFEMNHEVSVPIGLFGGKKFKLYANQLARLFIVILIVLNLTLVFFTFKKSTYDYGILVLLILHVLIMLPLIFHWNRIVLKS